MKTMTNTWLLLSALLLHVLSSYAVSVPNSHKPSTLLLDNSFDISVLSSESESAFLARQNEDGQPDETPDPSGPSSATRIAPAVVVVLIIVVAGGIGYFYWRRRRQQVFVEAVMTDGQTGQGSNFNEPL